LIDEPKTVVQEYGMATAVKRGNVRYDDLGKYVQDYAESVDLDSLIRNARHYRGLFFNLRYDRRVLEEPEIPETSVKPHAA